MKKIFAVLTAALMFFSFTACSIQVKKAEEVEAEKASQAAVSVQFEKKYSEMNLSEKLEYKAGQIKTSITPSDNGMLAPAKDASGGLWGYINSLGEWVIKPEYEYAYQFKGNMAPVFDSNRSYHIIKRDGSVFISKIGRNAIDSAHHFSDGFVAINLGIGYEQSKLYLAADGLSLIYASKLPLTNGIKYQSREYFAVATPFVNDCAVTMRRTNASVITAHDNNRANIANKGYYQSPCVIDAMGNVTATLPAGYDVTDYSLDKNGIIIVNNMTVESQPFGLCDTQGNITAECRFTRIIHSEGNLYLACNSEGFWGYIDKNGRTVIDFKFHQAQPFSFGLAAVCEDKLWGVIDERGNYVIEPEWDNFATLYCAHQDYAAGNAAFSEEGVAAARKGDYWALIDSEGNIIDCTYAPQVEESPYRTVSAGLVVFETYTDGKSSGSCGLMDIEGNICLAGGKFADIGLFNDEKHPA